ncbi:chromosome segregation protein SMC [Turicibacter sanguinis]|jgi:chromosome segregation protein SMC|uniref:Chromosome partition protein Smc n=2 Tax=Turicibacter sanguinis TaxID=154288 RepID=A0A9X4XBK7_9FIRM|nr:chromosome segregation protein SMC [Turicibacter sanguinis]EFF64660.1 chromosome segregation protein SMC [Turicibacter sanguinis PC909]MCU7191308.1 chromosome segregation protein SMC [Turicibacter sanguinis]MDB8554229.1 chromosome segregation protein SMC [Turicibacter sanguinis]MDB8557283.1 chromosome segregation protein SMC [Turicibacter sanguinis]MDB8560056.1 chromosome segregation protein SMC [Turicibacter sanguinis]
MYLKRIETIGFKSFADKTVVEFERGVTAVVGPNGSGKSNISDSIRWVLGEQSAKSLRGGKMEDIIFAGTSTRKPLNFAEVTLVLDNSCQSLPIDYDEVSITRRVYRTGDSEYLINKQKVRLKDVIDLIMDSGIGHDSLSIISQDKVKAIVEARVEDRRVIIEEAAGVLKYKMRKKEATRKLESTSDNLSRVQDIIFELEDQVEPLRKQSEKAEKYMVLKKECSESEISVLAYDIKTLNDQMERSKKERKEVEFEHLSINGKIATDERRMDNLKQTQQAQEQQLEALQTELVETSELIQKLQGQRDVLKERHKNASSNKEQLTEQQVELEQQLELATKQLELATSSMKETESRLLAKQTQLNQVTEEYQHLEENLKTELESTREAYFEDVNELASVKNQYISINQQIKKTEVTLERISGDENKSLIDRETLRREQEGFKQEYDKLSAQLKEKREEYQTLQKTHQHSLKQLEMETNRFRQLTHQVDKMMNRLQWLEDAQKDFSGFNEGVKKILKAREQNQINGIEGAVAELVSVPKELELAMDVVLGPVMQQIVTTSDDAAKNAIDFLKRHHAGRATFLPLNVIKSRVLPMDVLNRIQNNQDVVGVASQLVGYEERYRQIVENILGSIIVTKDLNVAKNLAKQLNYRYRIVTLEGDVINAGGAMTGGAVKRQGSSLLRQKNEIEDCQKKIAELNEEVEQSKGLQQELQEVVKNSEKQLSKLQSAGERLKDKMSETNQQKLAFEYREKAQNERDELLRIERREHESEYKQLVEKNNDLAESRLRLENRIESAKGIIDTLEEQLEQQEEMKTQLMEVMTELKVEVAKLETALTSEIATHYRLQEESGQAKERLAELINRLEQSEQEMLGNDDEVISLETQIEQQKESRESIVEKIQEQRLTLTKVSQELEVLEREVRESHKIHQKMTESINQLDVAIGKVDVEMDLMIKKLEEEHQMTFDYANEHYPLKGSIEEVKQKIRSLKGQIASLGEINVAAIAEYQRVKERYEFLTTQRDDLIEAKANLEETINEMDQEMTIKFKETFDLVRVEYIEIFKKLFGGGTADLVLTDPHDLLNTGVEIIAQPPGTKLKTSNLLSGGQKALTSIALLFAILKVRTVPFCVLDEVEAALDEANVSRYANYLKAFSKETQFIVITHRKGTMEKADVLYGVTMQERGVTKLVSVRMDNVSDYLDDEK